MQSLGDRDAEDEVNRYLAAIKRVEGSCVWKKKQHQDYREVVKFVTCSEMPEVNGELRMTAHISRIPQKMSFSLLLGSVRVFNLDVNPATFHINSKTLELIYETHWQRYPTNEATSDPRELTHQQWLIEFCKRSNLVLNMVYRAPPHEPPQLSLL